MTRFNLSSADGTTTNVDILTDLIGVFDGSENFTVCQILGTDGTTGKVVLGTFNKVKHSVSELAAFAVTNSLILTAYEVNKNQTSLPAPTGVAGTVDSAVQVTITWVKSARANGYIVRRATNVGFTTGVVDFTVGDVATKAVTGLTTATAYWFKVIPLYNGIQGVASASITRTTS
jgi:hypothetical protein